MGKYLKYKKQNLHHKIFMLQNFFFFSGSVSSKYSEICSDLQIHWQSHWLTGPMFKLRPISFH